MPITHPRLLARLPIRALARPLAGLLGALLAAAALPTQAAASWTDYDPPASYAATATRTGYRIPMSDGVTLAASVIFPADAAGNLAAGPLPVVLTQDSYNKAVPAANSASPYLVRHGYAQVIVDVRGTGNSGGVWQAFDDREQQDSAEIIDWLVQQPWCDGRIGTYGASYLGINQLFTAQWQKPAHKAAFAIVPMADGYRDIVFTGGNVNVTFIPLWFGIISALGAIPTDPKLAPTMVLQTLLQHLAGTTLGFQVPTVLRSAAGDPALAYDGPFWRLRSPIEIVDRVKIPTFVVGGTHDLFQRGEPLLYSRLKARVPAGLLIGPWAHIEAAIGLGLPHDGVPPIEHIALQWFDRHVRGQRGNGMDAQPKVTQWFYGEERYATQPDWPHPQAVAQRYTLHTGGLLDSRAAGPLEAPTALLQQPLNGLCSMSLAQWTAGALSGGTLGAGRPQDTEAYYRLRQLELPCVADNRFDETLFEKTFTSAPFTADTAFNGPIEADLWVSTSDLDATVSVFVTDVDPSGRSLPITNGIQRLSLRAVDDRGPATYRLNDAARRPQRLRPWHPFTQASLLPVPRGEAVAVAVEVFPSSFVIRSGHRLRVAIGPGDLAQGMPPVPALLRSALGVMKIHTDAAHPSTIVLPKVPLPD